MADQADVLDSLQGILAGTLFPNGTDQPSIAGACVQIFQGWPLPSQLDGAMAAGRTLVSIFPTTSTNTTTFLERWIDVVTNSPTLWVTTSGQSIIIGGELPPDGNPQIVSIFANRRPYVYAVQPEDTLNTIAAALGSLVSAGVSGVSVSASEIKFPAGVLVGPVRIGCQATSVREIARQLDQYQITVWSPTPSNRTAFARAIDAALKALTFINLPDFTAGRIRFVTSRWNDAEQKEAIYRRDLIYSVEYATTQLLITEQVTQVGIDIKVEVGDDSIAEIWIGEDQILLATIPGLQTESGTSLLTEGGSYIDLDMPTSIVTEKSQGLSTEDGLSLSE